MRKRKVRIHVKDKIDFLKFYEKIENNVLKECVMWKEQKDKEGNETGKVEIKIISLIYLLDVRDELKLIKD